MAEDHTEPKTVWFGDQYCLYEGPTDHFPSLVFEVPWEGQSVNSNDMQDAYNPRRHWAAKTIYVVNAAPVLPDPRPARYSALQPLHRRCCQALTN